MVTETAPNDTDSNESQIRKRGHEITSEIPIENVTENFATRKNGVFATS